MRPGRYIVLTHTDIAPDALARIAAGSVQSSLVYLTENPHMAEPAWRIMVERTRTDPDAVCPHDGLHWFPTLRCHLAASPWTTAPR